MLGLMVSSAFFYVGVVSEEVYVVHVSGCGSFDGVVVVVKLFVGFGKCGVECERKSCGGHGTSHGDSPVGSVGFVSPCCLGGSGTLPGR